MIPLPIVALALIALLVIAFGTGWNSAVAKHRARRARLETAVGDLEVQAATLTEAMTKDPQRAGIDMGKTYAVNQVQRTLDRIREEVPQ